MRTTVTIDPDLAAKLKAFARERGISLDVAINSVLRHSLTSDASGGSKRRYKLASRRLGLRSEPDLEHALGLAGAAEDAETIRKLERRR
jgi:hypothetical protein